MENESTSTSQGKEVTSFFFGALFGILLMVFYLPIAVCRAIQPQPVTVDYTYVLKETGADGVWRQQQNENGGAILEVYDRELEHVTQYYLDTQGRPVAVLHATNSQNGPRLDPKQAICARCGKRLHLYLEPLKGTAYVQCQDCKNAARIYVNVHSTPSDSKSEVFPVT